MDSMTGSRRHVTKNELFRHPRPTSTTYGQEITNPRSHVQTSSSTNEHHGTEEKPLRSSPLRKPARTLEAQNL
ncbi:hypothetical protein CPLU01_09555 [Colletotrichum plurivorum]|uniref:Uncharacterized protein n=1 Tax=Colletotrichum plurivorum TaxID=2175906 RepID=A0A8H6K821_9PEZI|nr:hypothetical protein CPLU01_09555 [Colletotrichum plurivorum]